MAEVNRERHSTRDLIARQRLGHRASWFYCTGVGEAGTSAGVGEAGAWDEGDGVGEADGTGVVTG